MYINTHNVYIPIYEHQYHKYCIILGLITNLGVGNLSILHHKETHCGVPNTSHLVEIYLMVMQFKSKESQDTGETGHW